MLYSTTMVQTHDCKQQATQGGCSKALAEA